MYCEDDAGGVEFVHGVFVDVDCYLFGVLLDGLLPVEGFVDAK